MKIVTQTEKYMVIDEFLDRDTFDQITTYCQEQDYEFKNAVTWDKVWRTGDGRPLIQREKIIFNRRFSIDPDNPASIFAAQLNALVSQKVNFIKKTWNSFSCVSSIYPADTALSWHDDGKDKLGAYSYYTHPSWNVLWGGELQIADHAPIESLGKDNTVTANNQSLHNRVENEFLMEIGSGVYIMPKPNRLVLLAPKTLHMVRRVDKNAGNNCRMSLQGFFI